MASLSSATWVKGRCLLGDHRADKDGLPERTLGLFVFAQRGAGRGVRERLWEAAADGVQHLVLRALPLIETCCPVNEFSLRRLL